MREAHADDLFEPIFAQADRLEAMPTAVAHPCSDAALQAAVEAAARHLIVPILVGPQQRIREIADRLQIDLSTCRLVDAPHSHAAAQAAVDLVPRTKLPTATRTARNQAGFEGTRGATPYRSRAHTTIPMIHAAARHLSADRSRSAPGTGTPLLRSRRPIQNQSSPAFNRAVREVPRASPVNPRLPTNMKLVTRFTPTEKKLEITAIRVSPMA
jgi:hypothetical protein